MTHLHNDEHRACTQYMIIFHKSGTGVFRYQLETLEIPIRAVSSQIYHAWNNA